MERIDRMSVVKKKPSIQRKDSRITEVVDHDDVSAKMEEFRRHARTLRMEGEPGEENGKKEERNNLIPFPSVQGVGSASDEISNPEETRAETVEREAPPIEEPEASSIEEPEVFSIEDPEASSIEDPEFSFIEDPEGSSIEDPEDMPVDLDEFLSDRITEEEDIQTSKIDGMIEKIDNVSEKIGTVSEAVLSCQKASTDTAREIQAFCQKQEQRLATESREAGKNEETVQTFLDALQSMEDQLAGNLKDIRGEQLLGKKELEEKIHTENVKSYGNMNEFFKENKSQQDSILQAMDKADKMRALMLVAIIFGAVNTAAILLLILKAFDLF